MPLLILHHCTSQACHFFGRAAELAILNRALDNSADSLVALVGPGGQGKTAILQQWLGQLASDDRVKGVFLWSFYRGKEVDLCLREMYMAVGGLAHRPDVSASYCVDQLLPLLRKHRWALILDGTEVVQYESGPWHGRFLHPELGRLLEELASAPQPGVMVLTSRFPLPELERRPHAQIQSLGELDAESCRSLLGTLGVKGSEADLDEAAIACGRHAKAVELLGTYVVRFHQGDATAYRTLPDPTSVPGTSDEEHKVMRVLGAFQTALPREIQDILALATAFRDPPAEVRLLEYLASEPTRKLLHDTWQRTYCPFGVRPAGWLAKELQELIDLRLLERVGLAPSSIAEPGETAVIDAHPLVRRGFEHVLGVVGGRQSATARAGFLRGRPDRRSPMSLEEAREETEMFHAYCDAGLWAEADSALAALDKPRYRFLAPAFERDLLLRFFPNGDWRQPALWNGFTRFRCMAICLELLGCFEDAIEAYRVEDAALRGDALIALGRVGPLLKDDRPPHPWQMLWQAYRIHALFLAGKTAEAVRLSRQVIPVDVYEWTHVFEGLARVGELQSIDMNSFLYRPRNAAETRWNELARRRMRTDYLRLSNSQPDTNFGSEYETLIDAYDRGGMPYERVLTRLGYCRWLLTQRQAQQARDVNATTLNLTRRHKMAIMEADAWHLEADICNFQNVREGAERASHEARRIRHAVGYQGPGRP